MAEHELYFATEKQLRIYKARRIITQVLLYAFLSLVGLFILIPFWYMIITSFKGTEAFEQEEVAGKLVLYLNSTNFSVEQFQKLFDPTKEFNFGTFYLNTVIVAVASTAFTVVTSVLAAFAFARVNFKGKDLIFTILLATMMVPGEMMMMTNYQTAVSFGWANTFAALILVHGVSVFYIFYLRQTFQQIPNELYLAAKVDGVNDIEYLFKVMIPIAMPTITTIIILTLMGSWNSFVWPNLVANGNWKYNKEYSMKLVSNGLMSLFSQQASGASDGGDTIKIAGSMVVTAPLFIFFIIFHKYIMRGVSRSGIKG